MRYLGRIGKYKPIYTYCPNCGDFTKTRGDGCCIECEEPKRDAA